MLFGRNVQVTINYTALEHHWRAVMFKVLNTKIKSVSSSSGKYTAL